MDDGSEVYLRSDPSQVGIVRDTVDEEGKTKFYISWYNGDGSWHWKPELAEIPRGRGRNTVIGSVQTLVQAHDIHGDVTINHDH